ncbi:FAD-dependent oxidoreductase [Pirellulimonas nuda]|nr:FAD-dependent oxidoreductase [Pirellulimonas nuda]
MTNCLSFFAVTLLAAPVCRAQAPYEVCVYGETASGVSAAIQAARMGKRVVLVSTNAHVGGMTTSGLTATDINRNTLIGGIAREFYGQLYAWYENPDAWRCQEREAFFVASQKRTFTGKNDALKIQWVYESHVGEKIQRAMLRDAGVELALNERLDLERGVEKGDGRIRRIKMESGRGFAAQVFIDATYEGDLMALAGVSYTVGREANSQYGESLNGVRLNPVIGREGKSVDPYVVEGDPASGLLPYIEPRVWAKDGEADPRRVQAYCYRLTLTDDPANRVAIERPAAYDPALYEVLARMLQISPETQLQEIITLTPMPNRKTDTNKLNLIGANYEYPEGDYATRQRIGQRHRDFALGMLWFLAHDQRVPPHIRAEMKPWGLPRDEFPDNGHFPYQLYVREARRMVGEYVMSEKNCRRVDSEPASESIGVGTYMLDSHQFSRVLDHDAKLRYEGGLAGKSVSYPISYRSITPKRDECPNLLVPVCVSASHVAYSSIRMEPVYMVLGQSAGAIASLAIDHRCDVQQLDYSELKQTLLDAGQILQP